MAACSACGFENREGAKFCSECGRALEPAPLAREERKVVTVLFADLVGFTAKAEQLDPEDVRAVLAPYHARLRDELERFGGTVEKFIGDAVMALFGAPVAHEDDPERAVRAALRIRDALVEEGRLDVRIGITTGEALVALGARPSEGEGMASGDVVNTAARLQSSAPTNGIIVDEATYRSTRDVIDYREAAPVDAKGKAERIRVWEVVAARTRLGVDSPGRGGADLVGRREELRLLVDTLARVRRAREPQLVTVTGVPGIGKSRLVYELFKTVEAGSVLTYWRQGRCLPYGEGVTLSALAEITKSHAGIFETDDARSAEEKLVRVTRLALPASDADWALRHLRPLVGLGSDAALVGDRRGEAFAAWRRLFEALAEQHPLVLVVEDIQWADDGLLDFLEELVRRASGVPLLVVCTGRPEVFDRRPTWGGGRLNAITVALSPLDDEETAELVAAHVERSAIDDAVRERLLARAGGNPLYAEEFARMAVELGGGGDLDLPDTVQGIIAARLDLLPPEEKELLQNAAVVGKQFWTGTVAALGSAHVDERLRLLEERDFVRRARRSSVDGEDEYAFRHILTRDVAYAQIPRGRRAEKHALAARWIDSLSNDRTDDRAEMLAFHYERALELARTLGDGAPELERRARVTFRDAGEHALSLNAFKPAARFFGQALELWPETDDEHPRVLYRFGLALFHAEGRGRDELLAARGRLLELGDIAPAVDATLALATLDWLAARREQALEDVTYALELAREAPARVRARALTAIARYRSIAGLRDWEHYSDEALAIAEELDDDDVRIGALISVGTAESLEHPLLAGPPLERAIEIARARNSPEIVRACNNLAYTVWRGGQVARALALSDESIELAEKFGDHSLGAFVRAGVRLTLAVKLGDWDHAERAIERFLDQAHGADYQRGNVLKHRCRIRLLRDDADRGLEDLELALEDARRIGDPQRLVPDLATAIALFAQGGELERARACGEELCRVVDEIDYELTFELSDLAPAFVVLELGDELARLLSERSPDTPWAAAARRIAERDYVAAAAVYAELGLALDEAGARALAAERLAAADRPGEAAEQAQRALAFFEQIRAPAGARRLREAAAALKQRG